MAYSKNLGKVKGEQGNIFVPELSVENGMLYFRWVEKTPDQVEANAEYETSTKLPVYYPTQENSNEPWMITFKSNVPVQPGSDLQQTFNCRGEKGEQGVSHITIYHLKEDETLDSIKNYAQENDQGSIYIDGTKAWIFDAEKNEFFPIEIIDFDDYYTKRQTYSQDEINTMFKETTSYMELMFLLLDVSGN